MPQLWRTQASRLQAVVVEVCWRPAQGGTSGDFHDVIDLQDGRVMVVLGDAPGSGAHAAELGEELRFELRRAVRSTDCTSNALRQLDERLGSRHPDAIATVVCALLRQDRRQAEVTNAGHLPMLVAEGSETRFLEGESEPPLGVPTDRRSVTYPLSTDAALFMFTDGLVERRDASLSRGLQTVLDAAQGLTGAVAWASELARRTTAELGQPTDDATVVSIDLRGSATALSGGVPPRAALRVYVDPRDPRSVAAERVARHLADHLLGTVEIGLEVIDITAAPGAAEADGVMAAPTIIRVLPAPRVRVVGGLRSPAQLARALQLPYPEEIT